MESRRSFSRYLLAQVKGHQHSERRGGTAGGSLFVICVASTVIAMAVVSGCGSKTGLGVPAPPPDDAAMDAPDVRPDVPFDVPIDVPACTVFGATAELLPLDVFMLFDGSGSMQEPTEDGTTKWAAVRRAIGRFFRDEDSAGIGVALTFFPQVQDDLPLVCVSDTACRMRDACTLAQVCRDAGVLCNTVTDCHIRGFPDDVCLDLGYCPGLGGPEDSACSVDGTFPCTAGTGPCTPLGVCDNRDNCNVVDYRTPAIEITRLPEGSGALLRTYDDAEVSREEAGGTPTLPAMAGTIDAAIEWARDNPTHEVVVVLATDGFPTSCDPDLRISFDLGLENIADQARIGFDALGITTFVIGVFGPDERDFAQMNLDRIAVAGGTPAAFIVNTGGSTTNQLVEALNQVRLDATACDFALSEPIPLTGETIWARITRDGRETWIPQVSGPDACGRGGFYIPDATDVAERIALCPESCALLGASPDRELELLTTCPDDPTEP